MIRKPAHKNIENPPGQIVNPLPPEMVYDGKVPQIVYDPVEHNMKQWKAWEESKKQLERNKPPDARTFDN